AAYATRNPLLSEAPLCPETAGLASLDRSSRRDTDRSPRPSQHLSVQATTREGAPELSGRKLRELAVDSRRATAALVERPDDQRVAAAGVARGEDAGDARLVAACLHVAALVALDAELLEERELRAEKAHREQDELGGAGLLGALDRCERRDAGVLHPVD